MINQWPDFGTMVKPKTIRSTLLEEGSGISERTKGEIRFDVETSPFGQGGFEHRCSLVVPKIAYRYPLLRVVQEGIDDYPVNVVADLWPQGANAGDEQALREKLGMVFRSDLTKKIVLQLLELLS